MSESIWKKEISFKRKAKPEAEEPPAEKQSLWKKEISLGRKPKEPAEAKQPTEPKQSFWKKELSLGNKPKDPKPAVPAEAKGSLLKKEISLGRKPKERAEKQSFWKKEISLGRKAKEPAEATRSEAPKSVLEKELSLSREPKEPAEPKQSFWKKEISLGRKSEPKEPEASPPPQPKESVLKREISLSRKKRDREVERLAQEAVQALAPSFAPEAEPVEAPAAAAPTMRAEAAVAAMPEPEPEPQPEAVVEPEPPTVAELPPQAVPSEPAPVAETPPPLAAVPDPEPRAQPAPLAAVPDPEPAPAESDVHPVPVLPLDAPAAEVAPAPVLPAVEPEPVAEQAPAPPPVPVPIVEQPPPPAPAPEPVAEQSPAPDLPAPAPVLASAPVEPWMEPTPVAAEPWLAAPEVPPAPEPPAETPVVVHPPVPAAELPPLPDQKVPFYKKELSFSRKPKEPNLPKEPKAASTPFWKKELSLSRKAKEPREPKQPKAASTPFWKRSISVPKPSLPSAPKTRGGHKVQRFVGLKIGASQLAAARVANNGAAELQQIAREPLEAGVVVGGELRDPEALGEALKRFFTQNKLPRKNVRLGIASNRIGVRIFEVTGVEDEKQLENAIHFRAQEALPIPLDEAVLDYHILDETVDDEGNATKRILLVVAYRELVDRYVSACRKAGISLAGIDLEAFALLRALSAPRPEGEPSDAALVAVAVGHDRSTFAVTDGRICEFTRVLEWGGSTLSVAIARALNLAPSEVEAIKRSISLESNEVPQGIPPDQYALAVDAVRKQVQSFARELVSSLQFYQNQPGSLGIGEIVITGGTASLAGLAEELQQLIGVRVRVGDPLARVKVAKKVTPTEPVGSFAVAIGLGIED